MRPLRSLSIVLFVLALASCHDSPTAPPDIGVLYVTPVALNPCGIFASATAPERMQMVDCGF